MLVPGSVYPGTGPDQTHSLPQTGQARVVGRAVRRNPRCFWSFPNAFRGDSVDSGSSQHAVVVQQVFSPRALVWLGKQAGNRSCLRRDLESEKVKRYDDTSPQNCSPGLHVWGGESRPSLRHDTSGLTWFDRVLTTQFEKTSPGDEKVTVKKTGGLQPIGRLVYSISLPPETLWRVSHV